MSIKQSQIEAISFDSFSTVVDVHSTQGKLEGLVDNPAEVSRLWRTYVWRYRPLCNFLGYVSHHEINRAALEYVFELRGIEASDEQLEEIARSYYEMEPFEDTREGMERLHDAGYDLYILSNGDYNVLEAMVENAEIEDLIVDLISADDIKTYKPHVRLYKHAARRIGSSPEQIAHVSAAWVDVLGGMYAGMQGIWTNREDKPRGLQPFDGEPDLITDDFIGVADAFEA